MTIDLQAASDTGTSSSDNITNATRLVFDVNFSESVAGLAGTDFSNSGNGDGLYLRGATSQRADERTRRALPAARRGP